MPILTEQDALAALDELESGKLDPNQALIRKQDLRAYREKAEASGLSPFPTYENQQRQSRDRVYGIFRAGLDNPAALPPETAAYLDERQQLGFDRKEELTRSAVEAWISAETGQKPEDLLDRYDAIKGQLAAEWDLPDASDTALFQHIAGTIAKGDRRKATIDTALDHARKAAINGRTWGQAFGEWAQDADFSNDEELEGLATAAYRDAHRTIAKDPALLKNAMTLSAALKGGAGGLELSEEAQASMRWVASQEPETIEKVISMALLMETPENQRGMLDNAAETINRFVASTVGGQKSLLTHSILDRNKTALESEAPTVYRRDPNYKPGLGMAILEGLGNAQVGAPAAATEADYRTAPAPGWIPMTPEERENAKAEANTLVRLDDLAVRLRGLRNSEDPIKTLSTSTLGTAYEMALYGGAQMLPFGRDPRLPLRRSPAKGHWPHRRRFHRHRTSARRGRAGNGRLQDGAWHVPACRQVDQQGRELAGTHDPRRSRLHGRAWRTGRH
jgi:hypothetical protein